MRYFQIIIKNEWINELSEVRVKDGTKERRGGDGRDGRKKKVRK